MSSLTSDEVAKIGAGSAAVAGLGWGAFRLAGARQGYAVAAGLGLGAIFAGSLAYIGSNLFSGNSPTPTPNATGVVTTLSTPGSNTVT